MAEELAELENLEFLGEDQVGLEIQLVPISDINSPTPENVPESKNQWKLVYNMNWGHGGI